MSGPPSFDVSQKHPSTGIFPLSSQQQETMNSQAAAAIPSAGPMTDSNQLSFNDLPPPPFPIATMDGADDDSHVVHSTTFVTVDQRGQMPPTCSVHFKGEREFCQSMGIKVTRSHSGFASASKRLNRDTDALATFLLYYNRFFPTFSVSICGYHYETRVKMVRRMSGDRETVCAEEYTETVTDFHYSIPLTEFIDQSKGAPDIFAEDEALAPAGLANWTDRQQTTPVATALDYDEQLKLKLTASSRQLLNEYVKNENPLKKVMFRKYVGLDLDTLRSLIDSHIRRLGYMDHLSIDFNFCRDAVMVRKGGAFSWLGNTTPGRILVGVTCMWIFFLPVYCITKHCCYKEREDADDNQTGTVASIEGVGNLQKVKPKKPSSCKKELKAVWALRPEYPTAEHVFFAIMPHLRIGYRCGAKQPDIIPL